MVCQPYWITPLLAIVPRPDGGKKLSGEMTAMREAGIDVVVSMLEPREAKELGLEKEETEAGEAGLRFINFPVVDRQTPSDVHAFEEFLTDLERAMRDGKKVGIHCRGCIGRSSVVAASLLVRAGMKDAEVWRKIRNARGTTVPDTAEQRRWVEQQMRQKPWHLI